MPEAVIVATARSPIGRANKGSLVSLRTDEMAAQIVRALMAKVPSVKGSDIEDLIIGVGQPAGEAGFNLGRMVALLAGIPEAPGVVVNRYCSSSLQTIRMAAHAIKAGEGDCFIAAGVEAVSRYQFGAADTAPNPVFKGPGERTKLRALGGQPVWTPQDGLADAYMAMGQTAENVREVEGVSREDMDWFAKRSQDLASANVANGFFDAEISPLTLEDGTVVSKDDCPREGTTLEGLAGLKPAFRPDGQVTAGNACPLNDGAAAVMVMSDTKAKALGLTPLARFVSSGVSSLNPEIMGLGPVEACRQAMKRAGMSINDIDLVEINEAFAPVVMAWMRELGADHAKVNVNGGAIALGHPLGATGARLMTTLLNELERTGGRFGLQTMCEGGGQANVTIIERL